MKLSGILIHMIQKKHPPTFKQKGFFLLKNDSCIPMQISKVWLPAFYYNTNMRFNFNRSIVGGGTVDHVILLLT